MSKIAADIILLPPKEIMQICIDLNRNKEAGSYQTFNLRDNLPHISLAMGVLDTENLQLAQKKLDKISNAFSKLKLELTEMSYTVTPSKKKSYELRVSITPELQELHNTIMKDYSDIFSYDEVNLDMFYSDPGEQMNEISCYWPKNYPNKSFENFSAHISLKCRKADYPNTPVKFTAEDLALSQLGNFCTCRKILHSTKLK